MVVDRLDSNKKYFCILFRVIGAACLLYVGVAFTGCQATVDQWCCSRLTHKQEVLTMSSSLSPQLLAKRRHQLYGPARCARYQTIQDLQREDHVQQSFRRGVLPVPSRETYDTITARDYKV